MAIYIAGDIHGELEIHKLTNYFIKECQHHPLSKKDYLILLGDCGILWDNGRQDRYVKDVLFKLPVTVLWIDGNHENFDLLNDYDIDTWKGGQVHFIEENIIHLMRGQVFYIDNKTFFTFGGASSIDRVHRREGMDWWKEEMPSKEEYLEGIKHLNNNNCKIDVVLTHTAPYEIIMEMGIDIWDEEDPLIHYLQKIADGIEFKEWMFGHFHMDEDVENFHVFYDRIIKLQ